MTDPAPRPDDPAEDIVSKNLTDADRYYLEQAYKDPVERIPRLEEAARFLAGATATTSGLFLAAFRIAYGRGTVTGLPWFLPFLFWSASLILFILVLTPRRYTTWPDDPRAIKTTFLAIARYKYLCLLLGTVCFIAGVLAGTLPFWTRP
jgi:hypothetical protein